MTVSLLCRLGHVASWKMLAAHRMTRSTLLAALREGRITRPRRGLYACSHIDEAMRRAAEVGGAVSCVSALSLAGVWAGLDRRLHAHVPPHGSMRAPPGVVLHWETPRFTEGPLSTKTPPFTETGPFEDGGGFGMTRMQTLWEAMACLDAEHAIAALESAVHEKYLDEADVRRLAALAPRRMADDVRRLDFRSQSGNETIVRLRLQRAGFSVEPQPFVPGMGHEDLLVEECVGLDVDGRKWHGEDRFAVDRERDIRVEGLGRRALRIWAGQIYETWPNTLATIERAVHDSRRERERRRGRVIVPFDAPLD